MTQLNNPSCWKPLILLVTSPSLSKMQLNMNRSIPTLSYLDWMIPLNPMTPQRFATSSATSRHQPSLPMKSSMFPVMVPNSRTVMAHVFQSDHDNHRGGGVAIFCKKSLGLKKINVT
uniref:Uncharacterized protein n=1 Tax=Micrurus spixii TaxID=129469 RepID=A0A2D4MSK3_9SAUR